jgi:mannose-1-phosphate guanylyltransferase
MMIEVTKVYKRREGTRNRNNAIGETGDRKIHGIILSGGEGKRLRPLTFYFQKCMIPIGSQQRPLLDYVVRLLTYHGVSDITMLVGYKHQQIVNYFDDGQKLGARIDYSLDDATVKGTGGSLLNALDLGIIKPDETLLIYYGDIISTINLKGMLEAHVRKQGAATLAVAKGYKVSVGVAETKRGRVTRWVEKPTVNINAGIGILALESNVLESQKELFRQKNDLDIMGDIVPHLVNTGRPVFSYLTDAFWYDVGSAERYEKLDNGLVDKAFQDLKPKDISTSRNEARPKTPMRLVSQT